MQSGKSAKKFLKPPKKQWEIQKSKDESAPQQNTVNNLEVHEWGVGFIQSSQSL